MATKRPTYKTQERKTTVSAAVNDACSELQTLRDECSEWKDGLEEKLSHTEKYSQLEEAVSSLDNADSEPDIPEDVAEREVTYTELVHKSKRKNPSRATRLANCVAMLEGARESIQEQIDSMDEEAEGSDQELKDTLDGTCTEIGDLIEYVEGVEFPGMFG